MLTKLYKNRFLLAGLFLISVFMVMTTVGAQSIDSMKLHKGATEGARESCEKNEEINFRSGMMLEGKKKKKGKSKKQKNKAVSYSDLYSDALQEAYERHTDLIDSGEISSSNYNAISYTFSDITNDGLKELIVAQVTGKHWVEYWIYGTDDGQTSYYMGEFGADAVPDMDLYGYVNGILYRDAYKGALTLGLAEWDGSQFNIRELYSGNYDRYDMPPSIPELSAYFDPDQLLEQITNFIRMDDGSYSSYTVYSYSSSDDRYNLNNYVYRTVVTGGRGALVFQSSPNGSFMNDYQYSDGDSIYVHYSWRQDGYAIAYQNGVYGYVDAGYIDWNTGNKGYNSYGSGNTNLSDYGYRTVTTGGRGALVFQSSPNGSFMYDYEFYDGDSIYVNLYWRQDGYAIAYQNGVYGYVDASYIDWNSGGGSYSSYSSGNKDFSDYGYRTVTTKGRGSLVFQSSPNGSFMYDYEFYDGDSIYVNLYWRQDGYAIAYQNGVYGYVDASYISW